LAFEDFYLPGAYHPTNNNACFSDTQQVWTTRRNPLPFWGQRQCWGYIVMLWVALSYRNDKGNSERTWEMMIQKEIHQVTSNLQEQQKDSRNIIIIL